tara:strand:- start:1091 stop:2257 length:1167 start_codon:yes stop_codon:yes gene_type:complete
VDFIYLDHNATTPLQPKAFEAMLPVMRDHFGNPSSTHFFGRTARVRVDEAREKVAELVNARAREIVFTSGGTESNNFAIVGTSLALKKKGRHILTSKVEHPSALNACRYLEKLGFEVEFLDVDGEGRIDPELVESALRADTVLVTIQHANSEVGTLQDIDSIGRKVREKGVVMHVDAVQSVGKVCVDLETFPVDLLSFSAHKLYGPKGTGVLYIRRGTPSLDPLIHGGGQEIKRRAGTENVPGIVGLGVVAEIAKRDLKKNSLRMDDLHKQLRRFLLDEIYGVEIYGHPRLRLPNTLGFSIIGVNGGDLLMALDMEGIAVSTGSACSSGSLFPSHVLTAMGVSEEKINSSLRISLGWGNNTEEVLLAGQTLKRLVGEMRKTVSKEGIL